ncbi:unnamed protein product [Paramecium octaurelia]|uniref:Uncharacterized protein n=1 Tax=Paramecium octaurelia TaxID=43137 RepID=A0A8S1S7N7_PAROT|nr:unnamed protein product [Paramecium octaurelia]
MFSERLVRVTLTLPKVEGNLKWESDVQTNTSRSRIISINAKPQQFGNRFHKHTMTSIASPKQIQLYTPMQESKRAKKLKNIPYELQYFTPKLPNKNFTSSHLMSDELLKPSSESIENKDKWQIKSHIPKTNNVFSLCQIKRIDKQEKKNEKSQDFTQIRKQNIQNLENEKVKRYKKYRQATQKLIDQFAQQFNTRAKIDNFNLNL